MLYLLRLKLKTVKGKIKLMCIEWLVVDAQFSQQCNLKHIYLTKKAFESGNVVSKIIQYDKGTVSNISGWQTGFPFFMQ